jgi:hypothetical protein
MVSEEEQEPSPEFVKAFNQGYVLQKHEPELLSKILKTDNSGSEQIKAIEAGKRQQQKEALIQEQKRIKEKHQQKIRPKQ